MATTHYTIQSPSTGRTLKVSYRGGKFFRLEQSAGKKFTPDEMPNIGLAVPAHENEIEAFKLKFHFLQYEKVVKAQSTYQKYVSAWFLFYDRYLELRPKFTSADGNALKQIKTYLTKVAGTEELGLVNFKLILDNWHKLDQFHRDNTDLKYINSRLNVILSAIKKANQAHAAGADNNVRI